jgi:hypothetical protein
VNSRTTRRFRESLANLPGPIEAKAQAAYQRFKDNPRHPSLQFKCVTSSKGVYSVRITRDYRALGILRDDDMIWFWIGNHADYEWLLK